MGRRFQPLEQTCLRQNYSLRRQLTTSYGVTAFVTIVLVVACATIAALRAGNEVTSQSDELFREQLFSALEDSSKLTVDIFTKRFSSLKATSSLLTEIVRDRIVGYPNPGWEDDQFVPFVDRETRRRMYPLKAKLLPRDWQVKSNWNATNLEEHAQERAEIFRPYIGHLSTESPFFHFQGNCNPSHTSPTQSQYFPGCTDDYNNATLGGAINPTDTLAPLEQKAADIGVFLKPLWESEPSAMAISVYFFNSGAGASLIFPSYQASSQASYVSNGCDWMSSINPNTGRSYGTPSQIAQCNPANRTTPLRLYNPMERPFCADQALHPGQIRINGPYLDVPWSQWRLSIGEAVFDRRTGEFIACTSVDLSLELTTQLLLDSIELNRTDIFITSLDGTVVAGSSEDSDFSRRNETFHITDTSFIDDDTYRVLLKDYEFWNSNDNGDGDNNGLYPSNSVGIGNGKYYSLAASPPPPTDYDPNYVPEFLVWNSYNVEEIFGVLQVIDDKVDEDVKDLITISVVLGSVGLVFLLVFVWLVAQALTRPLEWIDQTSFLIVNHAEQNKLPVTSDKNTNDLDEKLFLICTPKTEVNELVESFKLMIKGFSGAGPSRVASPQISETLNRLTWKDEFARSYQVGSIESQIKAEMSTEAQSVGRRLSRRLSNTITPDIRGELESYEDKDDPDFRSVPIMNNDSQVQYSGETSAQIKPEPTYAVPSPSATIPFQSEVSEFFSSVKQKSRMNRGRNLRDTPKADSNEVHDDAVRVSRSSLFWCVLGWICIPILVSVIAISTVVAVRLRASFPTWISYAETTSYAVQLDRFESMGSLRALGAEQVLPGPLRDLHLLTRITGWLLFDAIGRSEAFTEIEMDFVEECKSYEQDELCPFDVDIFRSPCDCLWEDPWTSPDECTEIPADPRMIQRFFYMCQKSNFDEESGDRIESTRFPEFDYSAQSTNWWTQDDIDKMPGSSKAENASGFETIYDRLRVSSAVTTIGFPIYNYVSNTRIADKHTAMSSYIAFEHDGAFFGYAGCNYDFSRYSQFVSSDENGAHLINEALCPKGKYGYDPRCRDWYQQAKEKGLNNEGGVHVTLPYRFATVNGVGNSAASPIVHQSTGEFVGVAIIDFSIGDIFDVLERDNTAFYAVVATDAPADRDTVGSSVSDRGEFSMSSFSVFAPSGVPDESNEEKLVSILNKAKSGQLAERAERFSRWTEEGGIEDVVVSWYPIRIRELTAAAPDDFTRGSRVKESVLYTLLTATTNASLNEPFDAIDDEIINQLGLITIAYLCVVGVITIICILITARISIGVTKPLLQLLQVVKLVNAGRLEDNIPPLSGGSREVAQVYSSFAKLYKIVRMSNDLYWSGDVKLALHIADDALKLFRKVGDQKAIAIAANNIANLLVTIMAENRGLGTSLSYDEVDCCLTTALALYDEAISSAQQEFESAELDAEKSGFAQQLADRQFNRGMLLLLTLDDPSSPHDAKERGLTDIFRSRELDNGTKEYLLHSQTFYTNAGIILDRLVRRLYGLAALTEVDEDVYQACDPYECIDEADLMLQAAWHDLNAPLFEPISRVGRLQQLEAAAVAVELAHGNFYDAGLLSTRMLVEDEYIIADAFIETAHCLLRLSRENDWSDVSSSGLRRELRLMKTPKLKSTLDVGRSYVFCIDLMTNDDKIYSYMKKPLHDFYSNVVHSEDGVGFVISTQGGETQICVNPDSREESENEHRIALENAMNPRTTDPVGTESPSAFPRAIEMVTELVATSADVFVFYLTDRGTYDMTSLTPLVEQVQEIRRQRKSSVDVISIGLDLPDEYAMFCRDITYATQSPASMHLSASSSELESFTLAVAKATALASRLNQRRVQNSLTMEKF